MKKIFIGFLTNIVAYVPVFVLIQLFRRTSSVWSKSKRLVKLIKNTDSSLNKNKIHTKESESMSWIFPWWFKIILYLFSFIVMASSIVLVTFKGKIMWKMSSLNYLINYELLKGIDLGDDRVKNWLASLIISSLFGFFITIPIQVIKLYWIFINFFKFNMTLI